MRKKLTPNEINLRWLSIYKHRCALINAMQSEKAKEFALEWLYRDCDFEKVLPEDMSALNQDFSLIIKALTLGLVEHEIDKTAFLTDKEFNDLVDTFTAKCSEGVFYEILGYELGMAILEAI